MPLPLPPHREQAASTTRAMDRPTSSSASGPTNSSVSPGRGGSGGHSGGRPPSSSPAASPGGAPPPPPASLPRILSPGPAGVGQGRGGRGGASATNVGELGGEAPEAFIRDVDEEEGLTNEPRSRPVSAMPQSLASQVCVCGGGGGHAQSLASQVGGWVGKGGGRCVWGCSRACACILVRACVCMCVSVRVCVICPCVHA